MYQLYKGYIPTKNKKATMKFKNADLYSFEEVRGMPEYAGVLNDGTILIDIDDKTEANLFMDIVEDEQLNCKVFETRRGMHFLFKNRNTDSAITDGSLACGISHVDVKVGKNASYDVIKFDGKERFVIWDIEKGEDYDLLPEWATPIKTKNDFHKMSNGDGRNSELFKYVSYLQREGLSKEAVKRAISIVNRYVFVEALPTSEIETLLRDERFERPSFFGKNGVFYFDKFARWLRDEHHLVRMNGDIFTFTGQVYDNDPIVIKQQMIKEIPTLGKAKRSEVLDYLELIVNEYAENESRYIAFKNGVYDLQQGKLRKFSSELLVTNQLQCNYEPEIYSPVVDKALNDFACGDKQVRLLLEEIIGVIMYRRNELRKSFILVGDKQNGKSTFLAMLKKLVGYKNTTSLDLKELGDRFKTAELSGKLVNIGDDIEDEFIANSAVFKKLVAGNPMTVERKGQDPFTFTNYAKLLFSANSVPKIKDKTGAVATRLVLVPFNAHFIPGTKNFDLEIIDKLTSEQSLSYLANLGIEGLKRVLKTREFTISKTVENLLYEYQIDNDSVLSFIDEIGIDKIKNEPVHDIYVRYSVYCNENGFKGCSKKTFSKQIKAQFGLSTKVKRYSNTTKSIFVKENNDED